MAKTAVVQSQQRWEYQSLVRRTEGSLEKELNELGQSGWELVSVDHGKDMKGNVCWTAFVKRPAAQAPRAPEQAREAVSQPSAGPEKAESSPSGEAFDLSGDEFEIKEE
jgi:hypothetical protein